MNSFDQDGLLKHKLYTIWSKVPIDYYQKGVKTNIFQWAWHRHKINTAKKILKGIDFSSCLDIGCASGYMVSEISESYPQAKYFGVDVYGKAIQFAKKVYPHIEFALVSADNLPFKSSSFDLIICYETIEHMENPLKSLQNIKRVLKSNGTLILAMDSGNLLFRVVWFIWEKTFGKIWQGSHLHPFHHFQLENLIQSVGFKIKKKFFTHFGMEVVFILNK
ncbi:MAG: Methyltransferase type 11 [Microgenomates group bacterium Gr01-1014_7]|nr:MAG: Methyltransferase type 11 [Microgenomates group bacterium Gr01-1014_7]